MSKPTRKLEENGNSSKKIITVEREVPELSYDVVEGNLKNLQGQVLTVIESIGGTIMQVDAAKSLVKSFFNRSLTHLFDFYGDTSDKEVPNYSGYDADLEEENK